MTLTERKKAFILLGNFINRHFSKDWRASESILHQGLEDLIKESFIYNNWFIPQFVNEAISNLGLMLNENDVEQFCEHISERNPKTIAIICAGNIPLVCFHDILCSLLCGHNVLLKMSNDDKILLPFFLKLLIYYEPEFENKIKFADGKLSGFDAVIATGSNNTALHLKFYFGKYPHIIRRSRTSVAVINGNESTEDLKNLGKDIFTYFGLGCRNVSKIYVPENYSFNLFFENILEYGFVINNKKYGNNYDYHRAIYLMEKQNFLDNNFLMLKETEDLFSPVGTVYYEKYSSEKDLEIKLEKNKENLQCIFGENFIPFGYSQKPVISEFADNVNTINFLLVL